MMAVSLTDTHRLHTCMHVWVCTCVPVHAYALN